MAKQKEGNGRVEVWQPAVLRLTAFTQAPNDVSEDWWKMIVDTPSETTVRQAKTQEYIEEGPFSQGKLTFSYNPIRIDWRYGVVEQTAQQEPQFNTLGAFTATVAEFEALMNKWFFNASIPPVTRLAFGAILLQPTETLQEGYQILTSYLPSLNLINAS